MHYNRAFMSSATVTAIRLRRRLILRVSLWLLAALLVLIASAGAMFLYAAHASLPVLDGAITVPGVSAPVEVIRDAHGVPHIAAATLEDLFFAQGYVTAQDRLWQMDMTRRYAAGELSEVLGSAYLEHDRQQRLLLVRTAAENGVARLSPRDRAHFEAYARGVNAYIANQKHLPIEFRVLWYTPHPWTPTDSFLVAGTMVQNLTLENFGIQLSHERLQTLLTPELAADLYPNASWRDRPPVPSPETEQFLLPNGEPQLNEGEENEAPPSAPRPRGKQPTPPRHQHRTGLPVAVGSWDPDAAALLPGSNNWVVSGAHTVTGRPLLANDMHLGHQLPNVWYEAHLTSGNFDVAGVTLPGLPFVVAGHNRNVAWGFTNIGPADDDLFVETFDQSGQYQTPEGWKQPEHRREVIHVRFARDQVLDVLVTRHGPIVSSLFPGEQRHLALKWTAHDPAAMQMPLFDMNSARNWNEFRDALRHFSNPPQNVVYADVDGHIGYQAVGLMPIRPQGDGSLPVPGADNGHEWSGYVSFDELPTVFDPPSGVLATANGRVAPDGYPYVLSNSWGPPYRTERIYRALGADRKFAAGDMLALQTDIYSDFDRFCAERFVYAVDRVPNAQARTRQAADLLRNWDARVTTGSAAATVVAQARRKLAVMLLQAKLGDAWEDYKWPMSPVWLEGVLLHQPARWLPPNYANWNELQTAAVTGAVQDPGVPRHLEDWKWGNREQIAVRHPLFRMVPLLRRYADAGPAPQSGNGYTVKQVGRRLGPSERMTTDFADLDASTLNIVNGQSGQIFSPHYMDQWKAWYEGTTFALPFSRAAVEKARAHRLVLKARP
jgi:penicillin amidase